MCRFLRAKQVALVVSLWALIVIVTGAVGAEPELTVLTWMGVNDANFYEPLLVAFETAHNAKVTHIRTKSGAFEEKFQTMVLGE